ncbi:MAG: TonB-dependent receptor [Candidatus Marinimicrobia bacterium]|nr:TonB-dependent receptor [Candidatus Neomarinimicrobiota bacterium]MCF7829063.1 TonB-dependent receptor [Candidatus Neomarinimicrobiota bacterium]MCF7881800.1 TonB-dependent receptor [Candidatus Neomarinimicrobiota bacterium]
MGLYKRYIFIIGMILLLGYFTPTKAQVESYPQPPFLINIPTAGSLDRGSYATELRMMPEGGVLAGVDIGLTSQFMLGVSYGGSHIIGEDSVGWNPQPGVQVKYRLFDESMKFPAVAVGFNSQGYHEYIRSLDRYTLKSSGFYVALSKNYQFLGNLGLHAGANYSLENGDGDSDPNLFFGIDKDINREISLMVEYNAALNDNESGSGIQELGRGYGYLNAAVRWTFAQKFHIEFDVNNLLQNRQYGDSTPLPSRELKIVYIEYF